MESFLKTSLGYTFVKRSGQGGGGCISSGEMYHTDQGQVFVKENSKQGADIMFRGELASLEALAATQTIRVPRPIKVLDRPTGKELMLRVTFWVCVKFHLNFGFE